MHFYSVRHLTKFLYSRRVNQSVMGVRMHPRSDSNQRCLTSRSPSVRAAASFLTRSSWQQCAPLRHPVGTISLLSLRVACDTSRSRRFPHFLAPMRGRTGCAGRRRGLLGDAAPQ